MAEASEAKLSVLAVGPEGFLLTDGVKVYHVWEADSTNKAKGLEFVGMEARNSCDAFGFAGWEADLCGGEVDMRNTDEEPFTDETRELGDRVADCLNAYFTEQEKHAIRTWDKMRAGCFTPRAGRREREPLEITWAQDETQKDIGEWADETFPDSTLESMHAHLLDEVKRELAAAIESGDADAIAEECADAHMIILHICHRIKKSLANSTSGKWAVNQTRKWNTKDPQGFTTHDKEATHASS